MNTTTSEALRLLIRSNAFRKIKTNDDANIYNVTDNKVTY